MVERTRPMRLRRVRLEDTGRYIALRLREPGVLLDRSEVRAVHDWLAEWLQADEERSAWPERQAFMVWNASQESARGRCDSALRWLQAAKLPVAMHARGVQWLDAQQQSGDPTTDSVQRADHPTPRIHPTHSGGTPESQ